MRFLTCRKKPRIKRPERAKVLKKHELTYFFVKFYRIMFLFYTDNGPTIRYA